MATWHNADGLYIKSGTDEGVSSHAAGEYKTYGPERMVEVEISLADLTQTETILNDVVMLPAGAFITRVDTIAEVAGATGTAIDVGLIRADRSTELDYNGLLAADPIANFNAVGETNSFRLSTTVPTGLTGTGALIGTALAYDGFISASMTDATSFTAGRLLVQVYFIPNALTVNG
jgi:hypothetical protein